MTINPVQMKVGLRIQAMSVCKALAVSSWKIAVSPSRKKRWANSFKLESPIKIKLWIKKEEVNLYVKSVEESYVVMLCYWLCIF